MTTPNHYYQEDHELRTTHYQPYQHLGRTQDQNAFGDDSDSEDNSHQHAVPDHDDPPEFDVYKDFNNSGVKYTTLLRGKTDEQKQDRDELQGHTPFDSEKSRQHRPDDDDASTQPPSSPTPSSSHPGLQALQPGSPTRQKGKLSAIKNGKNRWRIGSIIAFLVIACLGIVIFFLMPRQPFISLEIPPRLVKKEDNNLIFSATNPTNFSFDAQLDLFLDGRSSYLPTLVRDFKADIADLGATSSAVQVGKSLRAKSFTASSKNLTPLSLDVHFQYSTKLPSDTLWQAWRQACGNIAASTVNGTITRPSLQVVVMIQFKVIGMFGSRYDSTQLNNVGCPAELPPNAPSF